MLNGIMKQKSIKIMTNNVYVFHAKGACYASAIFSSYKKAQQWVVQNGLCGVLTAYPLNSGCYDWAIEQGYFKRATAIDRSPIFIGRFVSTYQKYWRFEHGEVQENIYEFLHPA